MGTHKFPKMPGMMRGMDQGMGAGMLPPQQVINLLNDVQLISLMASLLAPSVKLADEAGMSMEDRIGQKVDVCVSVAEQILVEAWSRQEQHGQLHKGEPAPDCMVCQLTVRREWMKMEARKQAEMVGRENGQSQGQSEQPAPTPAIRLTDQN